MRCDAAARNTSGALECEYSSRKWCSTSHTQSKPSRSASSICSSASLEQLELVVLAPRTGHLVLVEHPELHGASRVPAGAKCRGCAGRRDRDPSAARNLKWLMSPADPRGDDPAHPRLDSSPLRCRRPPDPVRGPDGGGCCRALAGAGGRDRPCRRQRSGPPGRRRGPALRHRRTGGGDPADRPPGAERRRRVGDPRPSGRGHRRGHGHHLQRHLPVGPVGSRHRPRRDGLGLLDRHRPDRRCHRHRHRRHPSRSGRPGASRRRLHRRPLRRHRRRRDP